MARALILVLDSFGVGGAEDAAAYSDVGADTFGHIARACAAGLADVEGVRSGPLRLPHLNSLGLGALAQASTGVLPPGFDSGPACGLWGYGVETSPGKDTPSGHWEMAGAPVDFFWGYFPATDPCFSPDFVEAFVRASGVSGIIGNRHASGTLIVDELGADHVRSGMPILYTSVDSVLQIAAHEETFGLERLYDICKIARKICDPLRIGRVIARPFIGDEKSGFVRTPHRKDYAIVPPPGNILERAVAAGRTVMTIGKVGDIFAHHFTGTEIKGADDRDHFVKSIEALKSLPEGGLIFANLVDLDSNFGHRRDVAGYALGLETFDSWLPELMAALQPGDLVVLSADHGNDPTWRGSDHTREHVPILAFGPDIAGGSIGRRATMGDIGASVADYLGLPPTATGTSWFSGKR